MKIQLKSDDLKIFIEIFKKRFNEITNADVCENV